VASLAKLKENSFIDQAGLIILVRSQRVWRVKSLWLFYWNSYEFVFISERNPIFHL